MQFDLKVIHRVGVKHQTADDLLPLPTTATDDDDTDVEIPLSVIQHRTHSTKTQSTCHREDCDIQSTLFKRHSINESKTDDVKLWQYLTLYTQKAKTLFVTR